MIAGDADANRMRVIGLIPARSGSKRVPNKNVRRLGEHPLLAYTIAAAQASEVFDRVVVSTEDEATAEIARHYGAEVPFLRPAELAADSSTDIDWIEQFLAVLVKQGECPEAYSILRPTSPFRLPSTIHRAWNAFRAADGVDSLRAVEPVKQHPGKMWVVRGQRLLPLLPFGPPEQPWHSSPTQSLPQVYVQNASLEISWTRLALEQRSIAGETILPFVTDEWEGFDINDPEDFERAERIVAAGTVEIPEINVNAYDLAN